MYVTLRQNLKLAKFPYKAITNNKYLKIMLPARIQK